MLSQKGFQTEGRQNSSKELATAISHVGEANLILVFTTRLFDGYSGGQPLTKIIIDEFGKEFLENTFLLFSVEMN